MQKVRIEHVVPAVPGNRRAAAVVGAQTDVQAERSRVDGVQPELMGPVEVEAAVPVAGEQEVVVVGVDAGVGLARGHADRAVIVPLQLRIDVGRLRPQVLAEGLAGRQLHSGELAAGGRDRGRTAREALTGSRRNERIAGVVAPREVAGAPQPALARVDHGAGRALVDRGAAV